MEKNIICINHYINKQKNINIIDNKYFYDIYHFFYYFEFLKEPQEKVQENNIIIKIELLKSISKHCHNISIESDNNRLFSLYGWKISKYSTKFNIFMNLNKFLKELNLLIYLDGKLK